MCLFFNFDVFIWQVEYFVDVVSDYQFDFIFFLEFFEVFFMVDYNYLGEVCVIWELAGYINVLCEKFMEFVVSYNVNIIIGSMFKVEEDGYFYNVFYLCWCDGIWEKYQKVYIIFFEWDVWGMKGGSELKVFDIDCGKVGIFICYDVEFLELACIYVDQGMQLFFVLFFIDIQNGYNWVWFCVQVWVIENECYVIMVGVVGNLFCVNNMDINYVQFVIFIFFDFVFFINVICFEVIFNIEMMVIVDVNLELFKELYEYGSVNMFKDWCKDFYEVKLKK